HHTDRVPLSAGSLSGRRKDMGRRDSQDRGQTHRRHHVALTRGGARRMGAVSLARPARSAPSDSGPSARGMGARLIWLQLLIGWLPIWALFALLILTAHRGSSPHEAAIVGLRMILAAALPVYLVQRLTAVLPWPHPFRIRFAAAHMLSAAAFSAAWIL